jgi:uncharacterized membrane protein YuzA (DUF378 family)
MAKKIKLWQHILWVLGIVGLETWGIMGVTGLFTMRPGFNLVEFLFGWIPNAANVIYILVGIVGIFVAAMYIRSASGKSIR